MGNPRENNERPSDQPAWGLAVERAYGCRRWEVPTTRSIAVFHESRSLSGSKYLSTGAFATDGGGGGAFIANGEVFVDRVQSILAESGSIHALVKGRHFPGFTHPLVVLDQRFFTLILSLEGGSERVWKDRLNSKVRNQTRKAKEGKFLIETGHLELMDDFFSVLSRCWRDLGTPTHSKKFYSALLECFGQSATLKVIYDHGRPVSAAMVIGVGKTIHHPFAGTIREHRSTSVNNLLYWSIIEDACKNGFHYFDLGRSKADQGTYAFKKSWGANPVPLFYTYISSSPKNLPVIKEGRLVRTLTEVWKFLPNPVAQRLGPHLIRTVM